MSLHDMSKFSSVHAWWRRETNIKGWMPFRWAVPITPTAVVGILTSGIGSEELHSNKAKS